MLVLDEVTGDVNDETLHISERFNKENICVTVTIYQQSISQESLFSK